MKASVIVPVWNGREYLPSCLDALLAQEYPDLEVIVVDNASTDGLADLVAEQYPQVRLIRNQSNLGFAGGCNVGLRAAQGDVLVLLNQDTTVRPGWLQALVEALQKPEMGVAGCKILYPDGETIQHAGGWIEWPLGLAHHYGKGEKDEGQWDTPRQVEYVTGAAMGFRRNILEQVGLLDEGFWPGYFEDADFCFRVREKGYEIWYIPDAVLVHEETTSLNDSAMISRAYQRGRLRFLLKHMPPHRFLTEFVQAEKEYQPAAIRGQESSPLRTAYLEAIPLAARLLHRRWQADKETITKVLSALRYLYQRAWEEDWKRVEELAASALAASTVAEPVPFPPPLEEFEFRSTVPFIGPLLARFRSLWYSVAARWAVRHLIQQQEAINKAMDIYVHSLEQRLATLAAENGFLAQEMAHLTLRLGLGKE